MKRAIPLLLGLGLLAACAPAAPSRQGGIVSLNPCADQLLLALAPRDQIAAISHYSQEPAATSIPLDVARRFRATGGTAEEVIALAPDLVIADSYTPPATRAAFARAHLRTVYLPSPTTIAASEAQVTDLARTLGNAARGQALVAAIERSVAAARSTAPAIPALLFIAGDLATGSGTLLDEQMTRAGFHNAAADYGLAMTGRLSIETIAARPPALILMPDGGGRTATLRRQVLAAGGAHVRETAFPRALVNCGGPTIPATLHRLAAIRRRVAG